MTDIDVLDTEQQEPDHRECIVVVDDEEAMVELLLELLKRENLESYGTTDPFEALKLIQQHEPGVVVTDLKMPGMEGTEVMEEVKKIDPSIEVIFFTAFPDIELVLSVMKAGACDFLIKPLPSVETLGHAVRRALERRRLVIENRELLQRIQANERHLQERVDLVTAELHRDNEILRRVGYLSRNLNKALDLEHCAEVMEEFFKGVGRNWVASVFRMDREEQHYELITTTDAAIRMTRAGTIEFGSVEMLDEIAFGKETSLIQPDAVDEGDQRTLQRAFIVAPALVMPLVAGDVSIGVMVVNFPGMEEFDEKDLRLLSLCGEALSLSMRNCELFKRIKDQAQRDGLTGLYNHAHFQTVLGGEFKRAQRFKQGLAMVFMDIDNFKMINDKCGHQAGDEVLRRLGDVLRRSVRVGVDVVCRYGGEEFAALLPSTDLTGATYTGERLREAIESEFRDNPVEGIPFPVTVSVGSSSNELADEAEALIAHADLALYQAKRSGKNQVCEYNQSLAGTLNQLAD